MLNFLRNFSFFKGIKAMYLDYFHIRRSMFGYIDKNVEISYPLRISNPKNVFLYDNCHLPANTNISAINAKFIMKANSGAGKGLTIRTGNHATIIGRFYRTIREQEKPIGYDHDVIVEEDVWIGCNVTILSGVIVGRGSTIGAGAVLTRSVPPYSVYGGIPGKFIKFKWSVEQILQHECVLYPLEKRYRKEDLIQIQKLYSSITSHNNLPIDF